MIYVCEYDDQADDRRLKERGKALLLPFPEDFAGESERRRRKRRERILSRLLLDFALRKEYGCSLPELGIVAGPQGKPKSALHPEIRFNISHCDTACACIIGAYESGIDIERKFPYRENLARRVCTAGEWAALEKLGMEACAGQLRFLWSLKESYVKWDGRGLAYGIQKLNLAEYLPLALQTGESRMLDGGRPDGVRLWLRNEESYTLAVCCREIPGESPCFIKEKELLDAGEEKGNRL